MLGTGERDPGPGLALLLCAAGQPPLPLGGPQAEGAEDHQSQDGSHGARIGLSAQPIEPPTGAARPPRGRSAPRGGEEPRAQEPAVAGSWRVSGAWIGAPPFFSRRVSSHSRAGQAMKIVE